MRDRIHGSLQPVRRRQLGLLLMRSAAWGLIVGSVGGVVPRAWPGCSAGRSRRAWPLAFLVGGARRSRSIIGALKGRSYKAAASAVDAHYKLKDRARTALDFVGQGRADRPPHPPDRGRRGAPRPGQGQRGRPVPPAEDPGLRGLAAGRWPSACWSGRSRRARRPTPAPPRRSPRSSPRPRRPSSGSRNSTSWPSRSATPSSRSSSRS